MINLGKVSLGIFLLCLACSHARTRSNASESAALSRSSVEDSSFALAAPNDPSQPAFDWPVDEARMTRGFFLKDPRGHSRRPHYGIDLAAPRKTPIYAAHNGTVIYVGREFRGFGRMIMIEGKGGWATLYAHLMKAHVKEGQLVKQGDMIGDMGRTGRATGVHLHFEIRRPSGPVDPLLYLPQSKVAHASANATEKSKN